MNDVNRNTGRTTGLMLGAMAEASLNRGKWIEFTDHGDQSPEATRCLQSVMQQMADALDLDYDIRLAWARRGPQLILRWPKARTNLESVTEDAHGALNVVEETNARDHNA